MAKKVKPAPEAQPNQDVVAHGPILAAIEGHNTQVKALTEAISRDRLPQTLLFVGPSGIGKKKVALGLTQVLVCERRAPGAAVRGQVFIWMLLLPLYRQHQKQHLAPLRHLLPLQHHHTSSQQRIE